MSEQETAIRELSALRSERRNHQSHAAQHRGQAGSLRELADSIDWQADPLHRTFDPVVSLHTERTWEGVAATAARTRLDRHEQRCLDALRSARGLAEDLRAEAHREDGRATADDALAADVLRHITRIEFEIGSFDHI